MHSQIPFVFVAICLLQSACSDRSAKSGTLADHPETRTCHIDGIARVASDSAAVRCAEWFVARNGYTQTSAADTNELATESIEFVGPWRDRLAERHNSLASRATVLCHGALNAAGFTVAFAAPNDTAPRLGRAVTMDTAFGDLRVQHVEFLLADAAGRPNCVSLAANAPR